MKNVVLTGGLGFIGSHLVDRLIADGHRVTVIDDFSTGTLENVALHRKSERLTVVKASILHTAKVEKYLSNADAVVHLAAITSVIRSSEEPMLVHDVNVTGTLNMLEACVRNAIERFVFISSAAVYGDNFSPPFNEDLPLHPLSLYGSSKAAGEAYCEAYRATHKLGTVVIRLMNIYGPRRSAGPYAGVMMKFGEAVLNDTPMTIYGDGEQTRDFTYVTDAVRGIQLAMERKEAVGETFNLGTGTPCTVNHLAEEFSKFAKSRVDISHAPPRTGEIRASFPNLKKAKERLGYRPQVTLEVGLKSFMDWYRESSSPMQHPIG